MISELEKYLVGRLNATISGLHEKSCANYLGWQQYKKLFSQHLSLMRTIKPDDNADGPAASPQIQTSAAPQVSLPSIAALVHQIEKISVPDVAAAAATGSLPAIRALTSLTEGDDELSHALRSQMLQTTRKNEREMEIRRFKVIKSVDLPRSLKSTLPESLGIKNLDLI